MTISFSTAVNYGLPFGRRLNNALTISLFGNIATGRPSSSKPWLLLFSQYIYFVRDVVVFHILSPEVLLFMGEFVPVIPILSDPSIDPWTIF